jgi:hypothetical protein
MGSLGIEDGLHLVEGLEPGATALDAEMLVEKRAVLDDRLTDRAHDDRGGGGSSTRLMDAGVPKLVKLGRGVRHRDL